MTGHTPWSEVKSSWFNDTPEARAAYEEAKRELDECWEVVCRYGNCVCFVHPVKGDTGGWGSIGCPCENPGWRWVKHNGRHVMRCPECHGVAAGGRRKRFGPRTKLKCSTGCRVMWRPGRRRTRQIERQLKRAVFHDVQFGILEWDE